MKFGSTQIDPVKPNIPYTYYNRVGYRSDKVFELDIDMINKIYIIFVFGSDRIGYSHIHTIMLNILNMITTTD